MSNIDKARALQVALNSKSSEIEGLIGFAVGEDRDVSDDEFEALVAVDSPSGKQLVDSIVRKHKENEGKKPGPNTPSAEVQRRAEARAAGEGSKSEATGMVSSKDKGK